VIADKVVYNPPPMAADLTVAVLGLGEAGSAIAADLVAAGVTVRGYDPAVQGVEGVADFGDEAQAARSAAIVLSVNAAAVAPDVARVVADVLAGDQVFADLNTSAPALKREVAAIVAPTGAAFADVALLRPVPGLGVRTPALASGSGATAFAQVMAPLGMPVSDLGDEPGEAAARKLARSVFMKGLAAAIEESLAAGEALGFGDWLRGDIDQTIESADAVMVSRLLDGSRKHAVRRTEEMAAASAMLEELGVEPRVARAAEAQLRAHSASGTAT
jgi:3-hydroxyisobutyrate dehydrogenase-like beta-hydroxyacid dehydrogenase